MLAQRDKQQKDDAKGVGKGLGMIGGGIYGAVQGGQDPTVFGSGTSSGMGAFKGFITNASAANGGGGGGQGGMSSFSNMVQGGPGGGMNVTQLKAAGKTADAFRDQMSEHTSTVGDEDPKILGATDDEWDTLGAAEKWGRVNGFVQGQAQKSVMQKMADEAAQAKERNAMAKAMGDTGTFLKHYLTAPGSSPAGSNDANGGESGDQVTPAQPPSTMERFAYAASNMPNDWDVGRSLGPIMGSLQKFAAAGTLNQDKAFTVDNDTAPGYSLITDNASKKWQALPRPGEQAIKSFTDEDGNTTHYLDSGNGKLKQITGQTTDKDRLASIDRELKSLSTIPATRLKLDPAKQARLTELQQQKAAILSKTKGNKASADDKDPLGLFK